MLTKILVARAGREPGPSDAPSPRREDSGPSPDAGRNGGLVLTRHLDESIMIGGEIEVRVVDLKPGAARLMITAPRSIAVHRREVYDTIRRAPAGLAVAPAAEGDGSGRAPGSLVLGRRAQESIMIGDEIEVMVVELRSTTVKLKVAAPRSVAVDRREVFEKKRTGAVRA